jgi:hypothetical protein
MARPQVAGGGGSLQIWRVAANILNKQSWTADEGWSSRLGVGWWLETPDSKKNYILRNISKRLGPELILWHDVSS